MDYCQEHSCNNCIQCAIKEQTRELIKVIREERCAEKPPNSWQILKHNMKILFSGKQKKPGY